jgi:hypothetical protein
VDKHLYLTYSNRLFDPFDVALDDILIEDIAHHLATINRYGGAPRNPISVAEHSLAVSLIVECRMIVDVQHDLRSNSVRLAAKWGLLHDSPEYILNDMCRGLKHRPGVAEVYREEEDKLMRKIAMKFGLPWPMPPIVKAIDRELCGTEMRHQMHRAIDTDGNPLPPPIPGLTMGVMTWQEAETRFMARYCELWGVQ